MRTLLILIFNLILNSCSNDTRIKTDNSIHTDSVINKELEDFPVLITDPSQKQIISIPDTLFLGDTLKIKFKVPHDRDISITTPDSNKYFFLSLDSLIIPRLEHFDKQESLEIITNKTKGIPYVYGVTERELIFNKSGVYQIMLSQNLETEGVPIELVKVVYFNTKK